MLSARYVYVKPDLCLVGCAALLWTTQPNSYTSLAAG